MYIVVLVIIIAMAKQISYQFVLFGDCSNSFYLFHSSRSTLNSSTAAPPPPPVQFTFTLAYRICIDSYQLSNVKHKYEAQNGYYLYFERYLRLNRNSLIIILFRSHSNKKIIGNFNVSTMMFIIIVYFDQSEIILFNDH